MSLDEAQKMRPARAAGEPKQAGSDPAVAGAASNVVQNKDAEFSERYSRQILFPGIGVDGQRSLGCAHVAIVGCGATGAASASLLARAGVGTLTLIDRDIVEMSNLQRQVLYDEEDAAQAIPKAEAARRHIARFNASVTVHSHIADLVPANIAELLAPEGRDRPHIVLDATDNFETRYLINDFAVERGIPWIYAAAIGAYAATMNILPRPARAYEPSACLACIFPTSPTGGIDTCDTAGILATAVNLVASIQVTEALKFLTGQAATMRRTLLSFDLWKNAPRGDLTHAEIATGTPRPDCTVCGMREFLHLGGVGRAPITLCGRDSVQIHEHHRPIDFAAMRARLEQHADLQQVRSNDLLLRFRRGPHTFTLFADGRALIQGTTDIALARSLYARFIGS